MIKPFVFLSFCLLFLFACSSDPDVIDEDKFVDILVDYHIAEGIIYNPGKVHFKQDEKIEVYNHVFTSHDITKAEFDSTLFYYLAHPKDYEDVYERVLVKLRDKEDEIKSYKYTSPDLVNFNQLTQEITKADSAERDSVMAEIWPLLRKYDLPAQGRRSRVSFNFPIEVDSFDFVVLKADVKVYDDDASEEPMVVLQSEYENGLVLKVKQAVVRGDSLTTVRLRLEKDTLLNVERIGGHLLDHSKCLGDKHAKIQNVRLYLMRYPIHVDTLAADTLNVDSLLTEELKVDTVRIDSLSLN